MLVEPVERTTLQSICGELAPSPQEQNFLTIFELTVCARKRSIPFALLAEGADDRRTHEWRTP